MEKAEHEQHDALTNEMLTCVLLLAMQRDPEDCLLIWDAANPPIIARFLVYLLCYWSVQVLHFLGGMIVFFGIGLFLLTRVVLGSRANLDDGGRTPMVPEPGSGTLLLGAVLCLLIKGGRDLR